MNNHVPRAAGSALAFLVLTTAGSVQAYVRQVTSQGVPVAWKQPCITMHLYLGAPPSLLGAPDYFAAGTQAAAAWSYPALACTDLRLSVVANSQTAADVGYDHKNVIVYRQDAWCHDSGATAGAEPDCYPSSALALTSVFKNPQTGEILDTDIEFNAANYTWADRVAAPNLGNSATVDFRYALTHELGHLIGLDHSCYDGNDDPGRLNDNTGAPTLDCYQIASLPEAVTQTIMFPSVDPAGDKAKQRDLSSDDKQGACEVYPHIHDVCPASPTQRGCGVANPVPPASKDSSTLHFTLSFVGFAAGFAAWRSHRKDQAAPRARTHGRLPRPS